MKKSLTNHFKLSTGKWAFRSVFLVFISMGIQNANAQCTPDTSAPLPDNPNLPDITGECSVLLVRPTAYDACENIAVSGLVAANKLIYGVGTYTVTWTFKDGSNNIFTQTQKVIVNPLTPPVITSNRSTFLCAGDSLTLTSNSSTGNIWKNTAGTTYSTNSIVAKTNTTYTLTLTSGGCTSKAVQKVTVDNAVPPKPTITASGVTTFCEGGSVVLTSSSAVENTWTGGTTLNNITITASGTYSVTVKNGCGTTRSAGSTVLVKPITPSITATGPTTLCKGTSITLVSNSKTGNTWTGGTNKDSLTITPAGTTTYTLTLSNGCGPAKKAIQKITVVPLPARPFMMPSTVCSPALGAGGIGGLTGTPLTGGTPAGGTYSGTTVIGNNFSPFLYSILGGGTGFSMVTYTITDSVTGCSNSTSGMVFVDTSAGCGIPEGIEENASAMEASVFPNPTNGLINISIKNVNSNQVVICVVDVLGKEVYSSSDKKGSADFNKQINLEGLTKGIYTIKLSAGSDVVTKKLIIE